MEAYTEFPSEDFYQSPSEDDQTSGRPLARQWPSARKMGSKMSQKLQQHHHEEGPESLEPEPTSPGWSYHDATPAEAGGGLLSLAAKRKIFWASQLRTPKVLEDTSSNKAKRPSSPSVEEAIAWKVKEALTLSTIARGLDHRARQASDSSGACMCAWRAKLAYSLPTTHAHHMQAAADAKAELSAAEAAAVVAAEAAAEAAAAAQSAVVAAQAAAAAQCLEDA